MVPPDFGEIEKRTEAERDNLLLCARFSDLLSPQLNHFDYRFVNANHFYFTEAFLPKILKISWGTSHMTNKQIEKRRIRYVIFCSFSFCFF